MYKESNIFEINNIRKKEKPKTKKNSVEQIIKSGIEKIKKKIPNANRSIIQEFLTHLIPIVGIRNNNLNIDDIDYNMNNFITNNLNKMENLLINYTNELQKQLNECPCNRR